MAKENADEIVKTQKIDNETFQTVVVVRSTQSIHITHKGDTIMLDLAHWVRLLDLAQEAVNEAHPL